MLPGLPSFYADEIISKKSFNVPTVSGAYLDFKSTMKLNSTVGGFVAAAFLYQVTTPTKHTENDTVELVSNQVAAGTQETETNYYVDAPFDSGNSVFSSLPNGGSLTDYHTYETRIYKDHTDWLVNGVQIRTANVVMPNEPLQIILNIWTPDKTWPAAFSDGIQAVSSPSQNQEFTASVDSVSLSLVTPVAPAPDKTAPTPNPSTWASLPTAVGNSSTTMTAIAASDPSGVQYYFTT